LEFMNIKSRVISFLLVFLLVFSIISCNRASAGNAYSVSFPYPSFRDVPGVTAEEIAAIEAFQRQGISFIYGMTPSTEAFYSRDYSVRGFSDLLCGWLSDLFNIKFNLHVYEWGDLISGLENGKVDFTGILSPTPERRMTYSMTTAIVQRTLLHFRIKDSQPLSEIETVRPLRFAFLDGAVTQNQLVESKAFESFESVYVRGFDAAYELLKTGGADAFFGENPAEFAFDVYDDVVIGDFFPLAFSPVSMSTQKDELKPVISIMQKILQNGGLQYITFLYNRGYQEYLKHKLFTHLTDDERYYLQLNPSVNFAAELDNYPLCFYNTQEKQWQGIAFDVMNEITALTDITFNLVNKGSQYIDWLDMVNMLETGELSLLTELIRTEERYGRFIWPETAIITDDYALLSKSSLPNISVNEILNVKIGLAAGTAYTEFFRKWFPDHEYTIEYESSGDAFAAMDRGEVDMVMSSQYRFLLLTNYRGLPDYKANVIFDHTFDSTFGFNKDEKILCSIVDKALALIDIDGISSQWMRRTFDYRVKVLQAQMPLMFGIPAFLFGLFFLLFLLYRRYNESKRFESQVQERTIELNKSQAELQAALSAAKSANSSKSIFLANMSHEIRTPMNSIMGFAELAMDGNVSPKTKDYLEKIHQNSEWLLQIINDILDISKIESGKMELERIPFDIHELFASCRTLVMPKAVEKGIMLHFYAEPSVGKRPLGDPTRLRQVFVNLLSNAIKFTHSGMVKLLSDIVSTGDNTLTMHFEIKDSGIGMTPDQIEKVFDPFIQAETGTNRKYGGSGLGLAITKNIVEMMGGRLEVDSVPGVGSKFYFNLTFETIPVTEEEKLEKKLMFKEIRKPTFEGEVLVCEDNEMNQFVISEHLTRVGLKVVVAEDGKIGVEMVRNRILNKEKQFDLIFMDMHMPVMDGFDASSAIIKLDTEIPMVAMTANIMAEDIEVYKASGIHDCLGKPFASQELWRCLLKYFKPLDEDIYINSPDEGPSGQEDDE